MTDHHQRPCEEVSGIELAEIRTLMLIKEFSCQQFQRILDANGAETLEELDWLTVRNFLHYLRSL